MNNVNSYLADWSIRFLENKDIIKKEIVSVEKSKGGFDFIIHCKDKVKYFVIMPILENGIFDRIKNEDAFGIIALNNLANIRFVVSEWKKLTEFKLLSIYFVNPFSTLDKVWVIIPYIHDKVCDTASLDTGLKSMAEMVDIIGMLEFENKIKSPKEESGL
ncbi:MAG: hypothetical protein V1831_02785 [Candidatus Woesearchaeota archaeon]